ncbi:MAG: HEAT repeat domain-containing protein, partial [Polyangiaceae bacterium]
MNIAPPQATVCAVPRDVERGGDPRPPLRERITDPSFTPGRRDLDALIELLADDDVAAPVERAIGRMGAEALPRLRDRLATAASPLRGRIARAAGRLAAAGDGSSVDFLLSLLDDRDPKVRRNSAIALGHVRRPGIEESLLRAWRSDVRPEMRRSIASSLGKVGSAAALPLLGEATAADDAELRRIAVRAVMMIERTASRGPAPTPVDPSRVAERPIAAVALCRSGIEDLLREELLAVAAADDPRVQAAGRVSFRLAGPPAALFGARTMLSFQF